MPADTAPAPAHTTPELDPRADIVLLMVDHDPFKEIDRERLNEKIVIDTKGLWR